LIFLLDTNACIAAINRRPPQVRERLRRALDGGDTIVVSTIVLSELWYGAGLSGRAEKNAGLLHAFLAEVEPMPFDEEAARTAGSIRADLARKGKTIGAYDCLIAGHAMRLGAVLVTADSREFARIDGLAWQSWAE
jgi:tRNA(fMet)-specific endonuclease VapC